jgi:hypothetical protein
MGVRWMFLFCSPPPPPPPPGLMIHLWVASLMNKAVAGDNWGGPATIADDYQGNPRPEDSPIAMSIARYPATRGLPHPHNYTLETINWTKMKFAYHVLYF